MEKIQLKVELEQLLISTITSEELEIRLKQEFNNKVKELISNKINNKYNIDIEYMPHNDSIICKASFFICSEEEMTQQMAKVYSYLRDIMLDEEKLETVINLFMSKED